MFRGTFYLWKERHLMIIKNFHKLLSVVMALICCINLTGCYADKKASYECPYKEFIVVDVLDLFANDQGVQSGWFGEIVRKKFNMELNIITPNYSGGGDRLFEVRAAAGNLGDLIICRGANGELENLVDVGLLYNMESDLRGKEILKYKDAIKNLNDNIPQGGIYAIPSQVSTNPPDVSSEGNEPIYGPYIRWDLYKELGYPVLDTVEDLLPLLKEMQKLCQKNGERTYGFSLFKEWDDNMMNAIKQPCCMYGYDEYGVVLAKADGSDYQSIIDEDSLYVRMLNFYFEANQMGLVDPESINQNYYRCFEKYRQGQILYSPWPWMCQPAYNSALNMEQGRGFMMVPIGDMKIYSYGCYPYGNQDSIIAVGSQAEDPERLVDFIDWLYSDEGIMTGQATHSGTAGPEGLTWEMHEDGPYLTDFGKKVLLDSKEMEVPDEYGGGTWESGISALNYKAVVQCEKSAAGYYYYYDMWDSVKVLDKSALKKDWCEKMKADTTMEYLQKNNMLLVATGMLYTAEAESMEQLTIRSLCKQAIQEYSWKMIFAADRETFERLLEEMRAAVISYGYNILLEYDIEHAKKARGME